MNDDMGAPEIVVSLGTDHHHFDRLVDWIDLWLRDHQDPPTCLIQHGATRAPQYASGVGLLPRSELLGLFRTAKVVVVQGGPGSILDAREVGKIPIAVPRMPGLREVVDIHQVKFTRVMVEHGEASMAETMEELVALMEAGFRNPALVNAAPRVPDTARAAGALSSALERILKEPAGRISFRRVRQLWRA